MIAEWLLGAAVLIVSIGLPCLAGFFVGKLLLFRLPEWATWLIGFAMLGGVGGFGMFSIKGTLHANSHLSLWTLAMFVALLFMMTVQIGAQWARACERYKRQILAWQERLSQDQAAADGSRLAVAYDLENLGQLHSWLGHHAEAVQSYESAYAISASELGNHPATKKFLYAYSAALWAAKRRDDAEKIRKQAEAIRSPEDEP